MDTNYLPTFSANTLKQMEVSQVSADKKAQFSSMVNPTELERSSIGNFYDVGYKGLDEISMDFRNLSPALAKTKYGVELGLDKVSAQRELYDNLAKQRSGLEAVGDTALGIGSSALVIAPQMTALQQGFQNAVINKVSSAVGGPQVENYVGDYLARGANIITESAQKMQSNASNTRRKVNDIRTSLQESDNTYDYEQTDKGLVANLARIGKDAVDAGGNILEDPLLFGNTTAEGAGSILATGGIGGVIRKGAIKAGEVAAATTLAKTGSVEAAALARAAAIKAGEKTADRAVTATIAATEAAGAYTDVINSTDNVPQSVWDANPEYQKLIAKGTSPEVAKSIMANDAALIAAGITAPVAAVAGKAVAKLEGNPLKLNRGVTALGNTFKEGGEEFVQGGTSALAGNIGTKVVIDPNQSLSEGVGREAGVGAVAGVGMAGTMQAPSLAAGAVIDPVMFAGKAALNTVSNLADKAKDKANKASPDSIQSIAKTSETIPPLSEATIQSVTPQPTDTPEVVNTKNTAKDHINTVVESIQLSEADKANPNVTNNLPKDFNGNRLQAIAELDNALSNTPKEDPKTALNIISAMNKLLEPLDNVDIDAVQKSIETLPQEVVQELNQILSVHKQVRESGSLVRMEEEIKSLAESVNNSKEPIDTDAANRIATVAQVSPESLDLDTLNSVMDDLPSFGLSLKQEAAIKSAYALAKANQDYLDSIGSMRTTSDKVKEDVTVGNREKRNKEGYRSAAQMMGLIRDYISKGDEASAYAELETLGLFAQSENNKAKAIINSINNGGGVATASKVDILDKVTRAMKQSEKAYGVTLSSEASVKQAKEILADAEFVTKTHNYLVEAFPSLGAKPIEAVPLPKIFTEQKQETNSVEQETDKNQDTKLNNLKDTDTNTVIEEVNNLPEVANELGIKTKSAAGIAKLNENLKGINRSVGEFTVELANKLAASLKALPDNVKSLFKGVSIVSYKEGDVSGTAFGNSLIALNIPVILESKSRYGVDNVQWTLVHELGHLIAKQNEHQLNKAMVTALNTKELFDEVMNVLAKEGEVNASSYIQLLQKRDTAKYKIAKELFAEMFAAKLLAEKEYYENYPKFSKWFDEQLAGSELARTMLGLTEYTNDATGSKRDSGVTETISPEPEQTTEETIEQTVEETIEEETEVIDEVSQVEESEVNSDGKPVAVSNSNGLSFATVFSKAKNKLKINSSLEILSKMFSDPSKAKEILGDLVDDIPADVFKDYSKVINGVTPRLKSQMKKQLQNSLAKPAFKNLITRGIVLATDNGKSLAIVDELPDGSFAYNDAMLEGVVKAAINWLTHMQSSKENRLYRDDVANIYDVEESQVPYSLVGYMNSHNVFNYRDIVSNMSKSIIRFWGVKGNDTASQDMIEGIPAALAAEVLTAMGALEFFKDVSKEKSINPKKTYNLLEFNANFFGPMKDNIKAVPDLLEQVLLSDYQEKYYFGESIPVNNQFIKNTPNVKATDSQIAAINKESQTVFKLNKVLHSVYESIGYKGLAKYMTGYSVDSVNKDNTNKRHLDSLQGRFAGIKNAFESITDRLLKAEIKAKELGIPVEELKHRWGLNIVKTGRMHLTGAYNPQSSKEVREIFTPVTSKINLENPTHYNYYMLALAQMLGVGVHKAPIEDSVIFIENKFNNELKPIVDAAQEFIKTGKAPDNFNEILESAASQMGRTTAGLNAVFDYANSLLAADKTEFTTNAYLEADGVTNGPGNAMLIFGAGEFTAKELQTQAKVGFFLDTSMTMNEYRSQVDTVDLYETSAQNLTEIVFNNTKMDFPPKLNSIMKLMNMFFNGVRYSFDETTGDMDLKIDRGVLKSPLTITIYGAGTGGMSNNLTDELFNTLYEKMTEALAIKKETGVSNAVALFGKQASVDKSADAILRDFNRELSVVLGSKDMDHITNDTNLATFEFSELAFNNVQESFKQQLAPKIRDAIANTVGPNVTRNILFVQVMTQMQSIMFSTAVRNEVKKTIESKSEGGYRHFLSKDEMNTIFTKMLEKFPIVKNELQNFYLSKDSRDINNEFSSKWSSSLDRKFNYSGDVSFPDDIGVGGIPILNIGNGDALAMQIMANFKDYVEGTLKIFDGINMPIDKIEEGSRQANQAVNETWLKNPMINIIKSYAVALENIPEDIEMEKTMSEILSMSLGSNVNPGNLQDTLYFVLSLATKSAMQIQTRKEVLKQISYAVDQMAASGITYITEGIKLGSDITENLKILNTLYKEAYPRVSKEVDQELLNHLTEYRKELEMIELAKKAKEKAMEDRLKDEERKNKEKNEALAAKVLAGKVVEISKNNLFKLLGSMNMSAGQKEIFRVLRSIPELNGYKILMGTLEQLQAAGVNAAINNTTGLIDPKNKQIVIVTNPNTFLETALHEMLHAVTFERILNYYNGNGSAKDGIAVRNLEKLMDEFKSDVSKATQMAIAPDTLLDTMYRLNNSITLAESQNNNYQQAVALSEFIAYSLSNESLIEFLQASKTKSTLEKIAKNIRKFFNSLIGLKQVKLPTNLHESILINSRVLAQSTDAFTPTNISGVLYSSASNNPYGELINAYSKAAKAIEIKEANGAIPDMEAPSKEYSFAADAVLTATQVFDLDETQSKLATLMVTAFNYKGVLDPVVKAKLGNLHREVVKNLSYTDFLDNKETTDPNALTEASNKYNMIIGKDFVTTDDSGLNSVLPIFIAMATVDPKFQEILSKISVSSSIEKAYGTKLDQLIRNTGTSISEKVFNRLSGVGDATTVREAITKIQNDFINQMQDSSVIEARLGSLKKNIVDVVEDKLVNFMTDTADTVYDKSKALAESDNRLVKAVGQAGKVASAIVSKNKADDLAEGAVSMMNAADAFEPIKDLLSDFVGRTKSNANVYDLIKKFRAHIQAIRQDYRTTVPRLISKAFSKELDKGTWNSLTRTIAKTDITSIGSFNEFITYAQDPEAILKATSEIESKYSKEVVKKAKQLAQYITNGVVGRGLQRNAIAIVKLNNLKDSDIASIDKLVTLYALSKISKEDRKELLNLIENEKDGIKYVFDFMKEQRKDELAKVMKSELAQMNHYKGYVPFVKSPRLTLVIADNKEGANLREFSLTRIGSYGGVGTAKSYFFSKTPMSSSHNQGILQNVNETAGGVSLTGFTQAITAGVIVDTAAVKLAHAMAASEKEHTENLMPLYDINGKIYAYERAADPKMVAKLEPETQLHNLLGVWRGRQVEEQLAPEANKLAIARLREMYETDSKKGRANEYINLRDVKDVVYKDAIQLIPKYVREEIFGEDGIEPFYVRKDMLKDVVGYREASVGDAWTGNTRWSEATQKHLKDLTTLVFKDKAYAYTVNSEMFLQKTVSSAKELIVVKSVIVPTANFISTMLQTFSRGVSPVTAIKEIPKKIIEAEEYVKTRAEIVKLETDLRAADALEKVKLEAEIRNLRDSLKRLSIWPLIEAGEFTAISDVGSIDDDLDLFTGDLAEYMRKTVDKLPSSLVNTGKFIAITKDTAMYQALSKSVQYGDFLGKSIMYDHFRKQGLSNEEALAKITDEFVNYDRLPGRFRGALEKNGLLWFYSFKLRSIKVALAMLRENPLRTLMFGSIPMPDMLSSVGTPVDDNVISKALDGSLTYSMGWGQGIRAPELNFWYTLTH